VWATLGALPSLLALDASETGAEALPRLPPPAFSRLEELYLRDNDDLIRPPAAADAEGVDKDAPPPGAAAATRGRRARAGRAPALEGARSDRHGVHRDVPAGVAGVAAAAATRAALFPAGLFPALEEVSMGGTARRARG
jgi:hypothetical protein